MNEKDILMADEKEFVGGVVAQVNYRVVSLIEDPEGGMILSFGILKNHNNLLEHTIFEIKIRGIDCFSIQDGSVLDLVGENIISLSKGVYHNEESNMAGVFFKIEYTENFMEDDHTSKELLIGVIEPDKVDGVPFKAVIKKIDNKVSDDGSQAYH